MALGACDDGGPTDGDGADGDVFRPTGDTSLSGAQSFSRVEIPAGVTVNVTGDLVLQAARDVTITGRLLGDCVGIEIRAAGAVTVAGEIRNACSDRGGEGAPAIRVRAQGALLLAGANLTSSGPVNVAQGASLMVSHAPSGGLATAQEVECTVRDIIIRPEPETASAGESGMPGAAGADVVISCGGRIELAGVSIVAQGGGAGGSVESSVTQEARAEAGAGGEGGSVSFLATGEVDATGLVVLQSGPGGDGGDAIAAGLAGPNRAAAAIATGGGGGAPGRVLIRSATRLRLAQQAVHLVTAAAGDGGDATALASDGFPADGQPPQAGGDASAIAGDGGDVPDRPVLEVPAMEGPPRVFVRTGDAGDGGDALADAGAGGSGGPMFPSGGAGGRIEARGGDGGSALARDVEDRPIGGGGNGGLAVFQGGEGGRGASACPIPGFEEQAAQTAGVGGSGGDALGGDGTGGEGPTPGETGAVLVQTAANGGLGGDGGPPGAGGAPGKDEIQAAGERVVVEPSFEVGGPGRPCPPVVGFTMGARIVVAESGDPAGHDPQIFNAGRIEPPLPGGSPGGGKTIQLVVALIGGDRILVHGLAPWVTVEGLIDPNGTFTATGSGTIKGVPGSNAEFRGFFVPGSLNGFYTMTPRGEPPITYQVIS
jgi:hypothetical protein